MAWPATTKILEKSFIQANDAAIRIKFIAEDIRNRSAAGPVDRRELRNFQKMLTDTIAIWAEARGYGADMITEARRQFRNPSLDVNGEFLAMEAAGQTLANWVDTNMPAGALDTYDAAGNATAVQFTSAQLAAFRTEVDIFVATIG